MAKRKTKDKEACGVRGLFRVNIRESDGRLVGDSGWVKNMITNVGAQKFLAGAFGGNSGSLQVSHMAIGTGAAPASDATTLPGEVLEASKRVAVTTGFTNRAASNGTATQQFTATFASSDSFHTTTQTISNIGLYNSITNGSLMAGQTYTSSALATNQNVECTYQIQIETP